MYLFLTRCLARCLAQAGVAAVIVLISCYFGMSGAYAAVDSSSQMSLTDQAHSEIQQPGKIKAKPNDVQISESMLSLKDPTPEVARRSGQLGLALTLQSFQPRGVVGNEFTNAEFDLGKNGSTILPTIQFSYEHQLMSRPSWAADLGLAAKFAYMSQKAKAEFESGFVEKDVRVNTMIWSLGPQLGFTMQRWSWLRPELGASWGKLTYTQTSSNELANVSRSGAYFDWNLGLEFRLSRSWNLLARYTHAQISSSRKDISIQPDNYALGAKLVW
jgi:hypothetical protein